MKATFERITEHPLETLGARQFPLKGKNLKPLWQYETTGGDRLFYAVDALTQVVIVCVMPHATDAQAAAAVIKPRRPVLLREISKQEAKKKLDAKTALPAKKADKQQKKRRR
jgi:hypothetical protein